jgi:hypothetical protein
MKKIMTLVAVLLIVTAIHAQTLQSLFDKYRNDERFEFVSLGKGMMNMAGAFGGHTKNNSEMMSKLKSLNILTLNADDASSLMKSVINELDKVVEKGNFETLINTRDKEERVNIYYRFSGKDDADMLIVTKDKGEFSVIWFNGKMTKEEMMHTFSNTGKITNPFDMNGESDNTASK